MYEGRPQMKKKNMFRRKLLIYPRFQMTLIAMNTVIMLGMCSLVGTLGYFSFERLREMGRDVQLAPSHAYFKFIDFQSGLVFQYLFVAFLVGVAISAVLTLIVSHRLAGPLVRLKNHFKQMGETGKCSPISFRKGDYLRDLPPLINEALYRVSNENDDSSSGDKAA